MRSKRPGWAAAGRRSSLISALSGRRRFPVDFDELDETLDAEVGERLRRDGRRCARGRRSARPADRAVHLCGLCRAANYAERRRPPPPAAVPSLHYASAHAATPAWTSMTGISLAARTCLASNYWMLSSLNRPPCTLGLNAVAPFRAVPEPCLESTPNMCGQRRASIFPPLADTSHVKPRRRDGWHPC